MDIDVPARNEPTLLASTTQARSSGSYTDQEHGTSHGFIATPVPIPEPRTFVLFGMGFTALGLYRLKRNATTPSSNQQYPDKDHLNNRHVVLFHVSVFARRAVPLRDFDLWR